MTLSKKKKVVRWNKKEELKQAKLKIRQLEADMEYKTAESEAWKKMVEMAEQIYHINV